jgi:two-component system response regulator
MMIPAHGDYLLLVDDNEMDIELNRMAIRKVNHQVPLLTANGGAKALNLIREAVSVGNLPRVLFLDLKMPQVDGFEVLETLQAEGIKRFPVIIFSNSGLPEDRMRVLHLGADAIYEKPLDYYANLRIFRKILLQWAPSLIPAYELEEERL